MPLASQWLPRQCLASQRAMVSSLTFLKRCFLHPDFHSGPSYISAHSADVILSDIRPIKLTVDALLCINALLDEFLYSILNTACSLSTDKLRASLLSFLPTSLGKEALLEAEVELRAYWERTRPVGFALTPREDDFKTFDFQWAFEVNAFSQRLGG